MYFINRRGIVLHTTKDTKKLSLLQATVFNIDKVKT